MNNAIAKSPASAGLATNKMTAPAAVNAEGAVLTRADLAFYADMIDAAVLIPREKDVSPAVAKYRVMAKIVAGHSYGFDPIAAQENFHVIKGRMVLSARGYSVLINRSGRYATRVEQLDDQGCRLLVLERERPDSPWRKLGTVSYMREDALRAGKLKDKPAAGDDDNWARYTPDMFFARAITRVARRFCPNILDVRFNSVPGSNEDPGQDPAPASSSDVFEDPIFRETAALAAGSIENDDSGFEPAEPEKTAPGAQDRESAGNPAEFDAESRRADLIAAIESKLQDLAGPKPGREGREAEILKGRVPALMTIPALEALYTELCAD